MIESVVSVQICVICGSIFCGSVFNLCQSSKKKHPNLYRDANNFLALQCKELTFQILTFDFFPACFKTFNTTSVRGATVILSSLCMDVFRTASFSRRVQSCLRAFSIAADFFEDVSLYKYNRRSSGVKFVIGSALMSDNCCPKRS